MGIFNRQREFLETMHAAREGRLREAITDGNAQPQDVSTGNVRVFQPSPEPKAVSTAPKPMYGYRDDSSTQVAPSSKASSKKSSGTKKPNHMTVSSATWNTSTGLWNKNPDYRLKVDKPKKSATKKKKKP